MKTGTADPTARPWTAIMLVQAGIVAAVVAVLWVCQAMGWDPFAVGARSRTGRMIQVGLVLGVMVAGCLWTARRSPRPGTVVAELSERAGRRLALALAAAVVLASAVIATAVLLTTPSSGDEVAYLFQASMLADGRLWVPAPQAFAYLKAFFVFDFDGRVVGQYPPGWPALLAAAQLIRLPDWLLNPVLSGLTILALYRLVARDFAPGIAALACALTCAGGFFLFNGGSFFNHTLVTLLGIVLATAAVDLDKAGGWRLAVIAGLAFGAIAVTRHYDAILFALPIGLIALRRLRHWAPAIIPAALGALPLFVLLLLYYDAVSGHPLQTPMTRAHPWDRLLGPNFSVVGATTLLVARIAEFAEWLSPGFVLLWAWALVHRVRRGEARFYEYYPLIFLAGYWLYWGAGGARWGPRYIHPAFPFMTVTIAAAAWPLLRHAQSTGQRFLVQMVIATITVGAVQAAFLIPGARQVSWETREPFRMIAAQATGPAILIFTRDPATIWQLSPGNMTRNTPRYDGPVVFAHTGDLFKFDTAPEAVQRAARALLSSHPDRQIWVYQAAPGRIGGQVARLELQPEPPPAATPPPPR